MQALDWVLLRHAAVAAALVGEEAAGPLRDQLLAEAAITGQLTEQMEQTAGRERSAVALETENAGLEALAADLGVELERSGDGESGAAGLLEALGQEGLLPDRGETDLHRALARESGTQRQTDRTSAQALSEVLQEALDGQTAIRQVVGPEETTADVQRRAVDRLAAALGLLETEGANAQQAARRGRRAAAEQGDAGADYSGTGAASGEAWAAAYGTAGTSGTAAYPVAASGGGTAAHSTRSGGAAGSGPVGRTGEGRQISMAEISRFFERDARRY